VTAVERHVHVTLVKRTLATLTMGRAPANPVGKEMTVRLMWTNAITQTRFPVLQTRLVRIQKERIDAFVTLDLRNLDPCVSVWTIYNLCKLKIYMQSQTIWNHNYFAWYMCLIFTNTLHWKQLAGTSNSDLIAVCVAIIATESTPTPATTLTELANAVR